MAWITITFDKNGGSGGYSSLYANSSKTESHYNINYWSTQQSTSSSYRVTSMTVPTKSGKRFAGYYFIGSTKNWVLCDHEGKLITYPSTYLFTSTSYTTAAVWSDVFCVITINKNGGTGGTTTFYRRNSDGACFSDIELANRIESITPPDKDGYRFDGISYGGVKVVDGYGNILPDMASASISTDTTLTAEWVLSTFGNVKDYFQLASANLIPESSDSGESKPHVVAYNAQSETPATDDGPAWLNPTVTYRVVGAMTLSVLLGRAFHTSIFVDIGYMITTVSVETAICQPPRVTVSGVANEGADAVKTYSVSIPVTPRHRPQNLQSSISGGGELQQLTLTATCDPVVLAENNQPCASDVCHGRIEVSAVTAAYNNENAPTATNSFTSTGATVKYSGVGYKTWAINARKELT